MLQEIKDLELFRNRDRRAFSSPLFPLGGLQEGSFAWSDVRHGNGICNWNHRLAHYLSESCAANPCLLLYCRITTLKFARGRNKAVAYGVKSFAKFSYESALVLEQLAVASWSARLYYYGWIRKHREEGIGGLDSVCNDESGGADSTLFLVNNIVAWLMAPFRARA